jgi:prolipoprotein diacylglyceryltransferase
MIWRFISRRPYNMPIYMVGYGIWRFLIEYLRGDERGAGLVSFLSPSQLTAVLLIIGGAVLFGIEYYLNKCRESKNEAEN